MKQYQHLLQFLLGRGIVISVCKPDAPPEAELEDSSTFDELVTVIERLQQCTLELYQQADTEQWRDLPMVEAGYVELDLSANDGEHVGDYIATDLMDDWLADWEEEAEQALPELLLGRVYEYRHEGQNDRVLLTFEETIPSNGANVEHHRFHMIGTATKVDLYQHDLVNLVLRPETEAPTPVQAEGAPKSLQDRRRAVCDVLADVERRIHECPEEEVGEERELRDLQIQLNAQLEDLDTEENLLLLDPNVSHETSEPAERGAASIKIELRNGNITVFHGTDEAILASREKVPAGSWDALWKAINRICDATAPEPPQFDFSRLQGPDGEPLPTTINWAEQPQAMAYIMTPDILTAAMLQPAPTTLRDIAGTAIIAGKSVQYKTLQILPAGLRPETVEALKSPTLGKAIKVTEDELRLLLRPEPPIVGAEYEYTGKPHIARMQFNGMATNVPGVVGDLYRFIVLDEKTGVAIYPTHLGATSLHLLKPLVNSTQDTDAITLTRRSAMQLHGLVRDLIDLDEAEIQAFEELDQIIASNPTGVGGSAPDPRATPPEEEQAIIENAYRYEAEQEWGGDDIKIDEDAVVSISADGGAWVAAWVWVDDGDDSEDDEDEQP